MIKKKVKKLTLEDFKKYGTYAKLIDPETAVKIGEKPVEFFRDMIQMNNPGTASYSICRTEPRALIVDVTEYHNHASEGILPLDGDVFLHVGYATPDDDIDTNEFEVFLLPMGTLAVVRAGVWHHAPLAAENAPVNTLIILPERTYKNDCIVVELDEDKQIRLI